MNDDEIKARIAALPKDDTAFNPPLAFTVPVPDHWHGPMFTKVVDGKLRSSGTTTGPGEVMDDCDHKTCGGTVIICGEQTDNPSASVGPDFVVPDICPKCSGKIDSGFGLMGGGYGSYWFCEADGCDWFAKIQNCMRCDDACPAGFYTCDEHRAAEDPCKSVAVVVERPNQEIK